MINNFGPTMKSSVLLDSTDKTIIASISICNHAHGNYQ
uniref:Uncharacterized protein n=1 Tax=Tetranychus urticae TaxID=32264 RepID=T1K2C4_TETUR